MARRLFALDHNFPEPVLGAFADVLPMVDLVPIRAIDAAWTDLEDWELLLALHRHERTWDGLITNDEDMLSLPKEMTVLSQTGLTLVVAKGEGHNPIRAVGALLCHLPFICHHTTPHAPKCGTCASRRRTTTRSKSTSTRSPSGAALASGVCWRATAFPLVNYGR